MISSRYLEQCRHLSFTEGNVPGPGMEFISVCMWQYQRENEKYFYINIYLALCVIFHNDFIQYEGNEFRDLLYTHTHTYIYIYAFSRLGDLHFRQYIFLVSTCVSWESNPWPFALLTQCSSTEPQEHINIYTHTHTNIHTHIYTHIYIHTHIHTHTHYTYIYIYVCYIYMCVCVCTCIVGYKKN